MLKKNIKIIFIISIIFITTLPFSILYAEEKKVMTLKTNQIAIEDDANLLSEEELELLKNEMGKLSEYGNVLFKTTDKSRGGTSLGYIQNYYYSLFNNNAGVAFYIDMYNREICACATGGLDNILNNSKCNIIMDNVYKYATNKKYYNCATSAYSQMLDLLKGRKIAESMKYISNSFLALMISLFSSLMLFIYLSRNEKLSKEEIKELGLTSIKHSNLNVEKVGTHSVYSPKVDTSSSSSSSSITRSSSGSSGGGFSGSGGSHKF